MHDNEEKPVTILLAEDEDCLRNMTHTALKEQGYRVLSASNAMEALQLAGAHEDQIDLLLTDMRMPDMDGTELAVEFRKSFPLSKVIFMTAYLLSEVQNKFPGEIILPKPFCINMLISSIHELFHQDSPLEV